MVKVIKSKFPKYRVIMRTVCIRLKSFSKIIIVSTAQLVQCHRNLAFDCVSTLLFPTGQYDQVGT